jgi:DNA polymerase-3 subunit chi
MPDATEVDFYLVGSAENRARLLTACRLAEKACEQQLRVSVLASGPPEAAELDELLWTFSDRSFVPHGSWPADPEFAAATPVLVGSGSPPGTHRDVLINLGPNMPEEPATYARICEVVGAGDDDRQMARSRWRSYREAGFTLDTHDL